VIPAPSLKTLLLDYILELTKQGKNVPLSIQQRYDLMNILLHSDVKKFDFDVMGVNAKDIKCNGPNIHFSERVFDCTWTLLVAKCPNMEEIREMRLRCTAESTITNVEVEKRIHAFSKLTCLETNCFLPSGKTINHNYVVIFCCSI